MNCTTIYLINSSAIHNTSATSDKYLIMKKLKNICIFRSLLIVKLTFLKEMLVLRMALMLNSFV
jgi:hypothetical protein